MASKIGKVEWIGLYAIMGIIDLIQLFGDLLLTEAVFAPEAINEVVDPFIGAFLGGYFQFRGVDIIHQPKRLLSLIGVTGLEELTGAAAPAWIVDVWYIHKTVKTEESELQAQKEQEEWKQGVIQKARASNFNGRREPDQSSNQTSVNHIAPAPSSAVNFNGVRRPG